MEKLLLSKWVNVAGISTLRRRLGSEDYSTAERDYIRAALQKLDKARRDTLVLPKTENLGRVEDVLVKLGEQHLISHFLERVDTLAKEDGKCMVICVDMEGVSKHPQGPTLSKRTGLISCKPNWLSGESQRLERFCAAA